MNSKIKKALDAKNMSQKELADLLYVTPQAVSKWVNGESRPDSENIARIKDILGIDLIECVVQANRKKCSKNNEMKHKSLSEINDFDECVGEAKLLIDNSGIRDRYSKPVLKLIEWLLPAVIGLTYHQSLYGEFKEDVDYDNIGYNLTDYLDDECMNKIPGLVSNQLEYSFFKMGGDLFESFEPYLMADHALCSSSMTWWYKFQKAMVKSEFSPIYCELLIVITDLSDFILEIA